MNSRSFGRWILAIVAVVVSASCVAGPINLNPTNSVPGNAGDAEVTAWLNGLINTYNAATPASLPTPPVLLFHSNNDPIPLGYPENSGTSIVMPMGDYLYLVLKWGGGFDPGTCSAYYLGDITAPTWTFAAPSQQALSGYRLFTRIPEGGNTILAIGAALALLGLMRRWA